MRTKIVMRGLSIAAAALAILLSAGACGPFSAAGDDASVVDVIWLPAGDIFYQQIDFDGNVTTERRDASGRTTVVTIGDPSQLISAGCGSPNPTLFVAPDGGLGLIYGCDDGRDLLEWTA